MTGRFWGLAPRRAALGLASLASLLAAIVAGSRLGEDGAGAAADWSPGGFVITMLVASIAAIAFLAVWLVSRIAGWALLYALGIRVGSRRYGGGGTGARRGTLEPPATDAASAGRPTGPPHTDPLARCRAEAAAGDPDAQFALGLASLLGRDAPLDRDAARRWFQKAAAQGHLKARRYAERIDGSKPPAPAGALIGLPPRRRRVGRDTPTADRAVGD